MTSRLATPGRSLAALALAGVGSALWTEHRARVAEREHPTPHHVVYIEGTRLHYRLVGEGPPVLLLHGNLLSGADFDASGLVGRLARDHQVLVIDRPGFGHSDRPRGIAWTPARQAALLRKAAAVLGVHRPVVVGHSLGTQVALAMALQDPASVAALVLVGGYYFPSLRLDRWLAAPAAVPLLGDLMRYTVSPWTARAALGPSVRAMFAPRPVPADFHAHLPRELLLRPLQQRATAEDGSRMVAQARALAHQYPLLRVPVTLVVGDEDHVVSPEQTLRLHRQLPGSQLHRVPGAGHMVHHVAQDTIVQAVQAATPAVAAAPVRAPRTPAPGSAAPVVVPAPSLR